MRRAAIVGWGSAHPERLVPNAEFDAQFGPGVGDWLVHNLDIHQRYWLDDDESVADLAEAAAVAALQQAGLPAAAIDLIIVATDTPEYISPSTAAVLEHRLGCDGPATFDLNSACAGFVAALDVGWKYLAADPRYRHVLVVGCYAMSKHLRREDKKTVTLFADGAGAVVLSGEAGERGVLAADLRTDGQYHDWMGIYGGGARRPVTAEVLADHGHQLVFAKKFPKEINPATWTTMIRAQCASLGITPMDIDRYFFTQLNIGSIRETLEALEVPTSRGHTIMQRFGYTGSACLPMAFDDAMRSGAAGPGDRVMFVASGGGLAFGCATVDL